MQEKWINCTVVSIPDGNYELIELHQTWDGLKLVFDDEKKRIEVMYKEEMLAYRSCDEGDRWRTVDNVLASEGKFFLRDHLLFEVENSDFKKWFCQEKFGAWKEEKIEHHAFVTANDIVEVLALHMPEIKVIEIS